MPESFAFEFLPVFLDVLGMDIMQPLKILDNQEAIYTSEFLTAILSENTYLGKCTLQDIKKKSKWYL